MFEDMNDINRHKTMEPTTPKLKLGSLAAGEMNVSMNKSIKQRRNSKFVDNN